MSHTFTEGARRTLEYAAVLAARSGERETQPKHLLLSIIEDESHGAEILKTLGLDVDLFLRTFAIERVVDRNATSRDVRHSQQVEQVIDSACSQARLDGRHAELGTEHLLFGLAAADTSVVPFLRMCQVTPETIAPFLVEQSGLEQARIPVDCSLEASDQTKSGRTDVVRVIDAAANRAREAIRVVEDFVRFTLDDAHLSGLLKGLRHRLAEVLSVLDTRELVSARDTAADVGTSITTESESQRRSPRDVLCANFKRLQEATRTLEEFTKILDPSLAGRLEQLRYETYTLEKAVLTTAFPKCDLENRKLYLLVSAEASQRSLEQLVLESTSAGVDIVQLREKERSDRELLHVARRVREWTRSTGALFIMNDRPDLALLSEADGVHVGQDELGVRETRRVLGPDRLVGVSTHTIEQARQAVRDGADYIGVGPVFASRTKSFDALAGLDFVRQVAEEITLPWYAIGGIDLQNVRQAVEAGAARVAVSSAVCRAEKPGEAARRLASLLSAD